MKISHYEKRKPKNSYKKITTIQKTSHVNKKKNEFARKINIKEFSNGAQR